MIISDQQSINEIFYITVKRNCRKILLVEPYSYKYVPLGLIKLYTLFKHCYTRSFNVDYRLGKHKFENIKYDVIFIASGEFSYYHDKVISVINFYRREFSDTRIIVGGVYAITDDTFAKEVSDLGCTVINSNIDLLDNLSFIDYSLFKWNPWNFVFTTRGCKMKCKFCYVQKIEPECKILNNWHLQIRDNTPQNIMIHDNNILSFGAEHYWNVISRLVRANKPVMLDNGFDVRFWNNDFNQQTKRLADANLLGYSSIRFAFDSMNQDGKIQNALLDVGKYYPIEDVLVYVLVNYKSSFEECFYRANEVAKTRAYPFIQYYTPLSWTDEPFKYKGEQWTPEFYAMHDYFNDKIYRRMSYEDYKKKRHSERSTQ